MREKSVERDKNNNKSILICFRASIGRLAIQHSVDEHGFVALWGNWLIWRWPSANAHPLAFLYQNTETSNDSCARGHLRFRQFETARVLLHVTKTLASGHDAANCGASVFACPTDFLSKLSSRFLDGRVDPTISLSFRTGARAQATDRRTRSPPLQRERQNGFSFRGPQTQTLSRSARGGATMPNPLVGFLVGPLRH